MFHSNENMEVVNRAKTHDIEIAKKLALILSQKGLQLNQHGLKLVTAYIV